MLPPDIFLHAFDAAWIDSGTGELVRHADDFVVLRSTLEQAEQAREQAKAILGELGLELHPDKTRVVDLGESREGFDFLGCRFRARMLGRLWEQKRIVRFRLHRWPSQRSMKSTIRSCVTMSTRSSASRMRENRTYGLKGEWGTGPATAPRPRLPIQLSKKALGAEGIMGLFQQVVQLWGNARSNGSSPFIPVFPLMLRNQG